MLSRRTFALSLAGGLALPALVQAQGTIADLETRANALPQLHSLLVQQGDDILLAIEPRGPGLDRTAAIKSCSKSLLALLLGEAIGNGAIPGLSATLGQVAPGLIPADATDGVADLTMEDLVTLRAGLQGTSGGNYGAWVSSPNWIAYALRQPRLAEAGGRMIYSTGTTHILGAAITEATGDSLLSLTRDVLGSGLDAEIPPWTRDPQGYYFGGNEMALTPRAMLRVAAMIRDGGRHDGRQVVSADWLAQSLIPRTRSPYSGLSYGYGWFLSDSGWALARGYGGQIIAAHIERALAVAITSDPLQPARYDGHFGALMELLDGPVMALA